MNAQYRYRVNLHALVAQVHWPDLNGFQTAVGPDPASAISSLFVHTFGYALPVESLDDARVRRSIISCEEEPQ